MSNKHISKRTPSNVPYPERFDTPAFPESKNIELSRFFAIGSIVLFVLIIIMCGWLLWAQKNERLHAYLLYTDPVTQNWVAISETDYKNPIKTMPWEQIAMEYTIASYVPRHFYISNISTSNAKNWCQCQWDSCQNSKISDCTLCCISHPNVFQEFRKNELKIYEKMASSGETQKIVDGTLRATMLKKPSTDSSSGTMWRATVEIESRGKRTPVVMYIRIDQDLNSIPFPGFYVSEFNYYPLVTTK